jgi:hypothetical protein
MRSIGLTSVFDINEKQETEVPEYHFAGDARTLCPAADRN